MNFSIGTAQFGLNYGVTNSHGKVGAIEIKKILLNANQNNISFSCIVTKLPCYKFFDDLNLLF